MSKNRSELCAYLIVLLFAGCSAAYAQDTYPTEPIRIYTSPAGGGGDFTSRIIADGLTKIFGQQVLVVNGPGLLQQERASQAPADGYTLLLQQSLFWLTPLLRKDAPFDPEKDFVPISITDTSPVILVVHPSVPAKSVGELISLAKARPGELNFARASLGSPGHLATELFNYMAGVKMAVIPYKGGAGATMAVMSGEVHVAFVSLGAGRAMISTKRLRGLGVSTLEPSPMFPELPTLAAAGLPGFEVALTSGIFAPAGTPAPRIKRLREAIVQYLSRAEVKERYMKAGVTAVGSSPEALDSLVKSDLAKWGKVFKAANIRPQ